MFDDSYEIIEKMENLLSNLTDRQKEWYKPYLSYEIALFYFQKKEYEESLKNVKNTIRDYAGELDIILGNSYLLEGMVYDKLNVREKAKESYRKCIELKNFSIAMKKAEKYYERSYSAF